MLLLIIVIVLVDNLLQNSKPNAVYDWVLLPTEQNVIADYELVCVLHENLAARWSRLKVGLVLRKNCILPHDCVLLDVLVLLNHLCFVKILSLRNERLF